MLMLLVFSNVDLDMEDLHLQKVLPVSGVAEMVEQTRTYMVHNDAANFVQMTEEKYEVWCCYNCYQDYGVEMPYNLPYKMDKIDRIILVCCHEDRLPTIAIGVLVEQPI